jgi:hypothetical protein
MLFVKGVMSMPKYKVVLKYSDGSSDEQDEIFTTEAEAEEYGLVCRSEYRVGGEVLNLSNPGDYPLDEEDNVDFEIIEIDD